MCIRDSNRGIQLPQTPEEHSDGPTASLHQPWTDSGLRRRQCLFCRFGDCLLYTSDAADERSSVDLGGRRIIKKKKQ